MNTYIDASNYPKSGSNEERELIFKAQNGDKEAFDFIVISNSRLVKTIAVKFRDRGLEVEDLYQVGIMGLMQAIGTFDLSRGTLFSTYIYMWISQKIKRTIQNQGRNIRIPVHIYEKNFRYMVATKKLQQELGREATNKELAEFTDSTEKEVIGFKTEVKGTTSLNQIDGITCDTELGNAIADVDVNINETVTTKLMVNEMMETVKSLLKPREFDIFCMRIGVLGYEIMTYDEIGETLNVSKQRVQQIYRASKDRLRQNKKMNLYKCS